MHRLPRIPRRSVAPIRLAEFPVLLAAFLAGPFITQAAVPGPDFTREVQPILSQHCFTCHGPDEQSRKAGLRLDVREAALQGGDSDGAAIVPGQPEASALLVRLLSHDADEVMPPTKEKKPLSPTQIETLRRWIAAGADYAKHWAFESPVKAPVPAGSHPVDALVRAKLSEKNLSPSPPAESAVLARRLYLDVIGLPPSPEEVESFEKSSAADSKTAVGELVERLLKNERHGEKWARHWLDVARYSDSNGYERDYPREQWAWRDWVVRALNEDMPYDRFVIEQIAGDLLPNHTQAQMVATGFLRNSMTNEEGAIIPEQFRMEEMFDRMDCVGKAVLGLTIQCAQCHTHKFDPISQDEYFGVFAFLNNTFEARSPVFEAGRQKQIAAIQDGIRAVEERLRAARPQWRQEMRAWSDEVRNQQPTWTPLDAVELSSSDGMTHPTKEPGFSILTQGPMNTGAYSVIVAEPDLAGVTGLRLEGVAASRPALWRPGARRARHLGRVRFEGQRAETRRERLRGSQAGGGDRGLLDAGPSRTGGMGHASRQAGNRSREEKRAALWPGGIPHRWQAADQLARGSRGRAAQRAVGSGGAFRADIATATGHEDESDDPSLGRSVAARDAVGPRPGESHERSRPAGRAD